MRPALWILSAAPEPVNELGLATSPCGRTAQVVSGEEGGVATKAEVERQLAALMARLDGNEANVRSAIPSRKVLVCHVPDLDAAWYSVVEHGRVSQPTEIPPNGRADITLRVGSDDLVDLVEGRTSFLSAFTAGKVKVDASIVDLLRLRSLL
jgi:SCP-2 sterol transfer family